jgi:hypothetical protein
MKTIVGKLAMALIFFGIFVMAAAPVCSATSEAPVASESADPMMEAPGEASPEESYFEEAGELPHDEMMLEEEEESDPPVEDYEEMDMDPSMEETEEMPE